MSPRSYDLARIEAIKSYAKLEHSLAYLLSKLIPSDADTAWTIFFKIGATRSRYAIITDLCSLKYEGIYKKPWSVIEKWLIPIDTQRNHIVHWTDNKIMVVRGEVGPIKDVTIESSARLINPARAWRASEDSYLEKDLKKFRGEVEDLENLVNLFALTVGHASALRDIFLKATADLTPALLLRSLSDAIPSSPPQSSGG